MTNRTRIVQCVSVLAVVVNVGLSERPAHADEYAVDNVHSSLVFRVKHNNVAYFYGRFNELSGRFRFDDAEPANAMFELEIKTQSVDTNNKSRDNHLKSPDFFSAREFPVIGFKSTEVKKTGDDTFEVTGDLSLHGATRPITATVERVGTGTGRGGTRVAGYEAVLAIKRSEFGMNYALDSLGDEVRIMLGVEGAAE